MPRRRFGHRRSLLDPRCRLHGKLSPAIAMRPAGRASRMSMSGTDLSMKPSAFCSRVPISKARSAGYAPQMACTSPSPARSSSRIMSSANSTGSWPRVPATPDAGARPDQPAPRPLAGPIVPLVASSVSTDQLLGAPGSRSVKIDAEAARLLIKGEPLQAPAGRTDDLAWPRREAGREGIKGETPVASTSLNANARAPAASPKPKRHRRQSTTHW